MIRMYMDLFSTKDQEEDELNRFQFELGLQSQGFEAVAGCDEVGRGPLAGPVVAASVILPVKCNHPLLLDSKKLSHTRKLQAFEYLTELNCPIGIGTVSVQTIDRINILQASLLAMKRSIADLQQQGYGVDFILVDGKFEIPISLPQLALVKGETKSSSIAAASIIAKVTRDRIMEELDLEYPQYGFAGHKGYPTKTHRLAIREHGPSPVHRTTFKGVKQFVDMQS